MKLNLNKPLVVFDLETTGLDLVKDRVIQLSFIKVYPDGKEERGDYLINPECYILPVITQLTGISNEDVKDKPTFKQLAKTLEEKFTGCDFAGFNSNYLLQPTSSIVVVGWRTISRLTVPTRIRRPLIAC